MSLVDASPDERHLALTAPARHKAFHQRIAEMAAALQREKEFLASVLPPRPVKVVVLSVTEDVLVAALQETLNRPAPELAAPVKEPWFFVESCSSPRLTARIIQRAVCLHYGVHLAAMLGPGRTRDIIIPRHVAMYLCKELTMLSLPHIGRKFGGRDHTTALSAIKKISRLLRFNLDLVATIKAIRGDLEAML